MASLLVALTCGCSSEEGAGGEVPANATQVSFILRLSDESEGTRAAWSEDYPSDDGTAYDKRIDPNDLKVALYHADGNTFAANVTIVSYYKLPSSEGDTSNEAEYEFIGTVNTADGNTELAAGDYKVMVFANCQSPTIVSNETGLESLSYTYDAGKVKDEEQYIPMWGVTTVEDLQLEKGKRTNIGNIDLLRAFAKVEIELSSDISDIYTITSASLSNYNAQGYCLPAGYADVQNTLQLDQEDQDNPSFHPNATEQKADLAFVVPQDGKTATLYIPEYDNSTDAATISLQLSDGTTGTLHFQPYVNGVPNGETYDIVRNHIYRYTVNVEQGELKVQAAVMPWNLVPSSIGWRPQAASTTENPFADATAYADFVNQGRYILLPVTSYSESRPNTQAVLSYLYANAERGDPESRYGIILYPRYGIDSDNDPDGHRKLRNATGGATWFFVLTGPKGATWEAHLTNEDFVFSSGDADYFEESTDFPYPTVNKVMHGIAREQPYVLQVNVRHPYTSVPGGAEDFDKNDIDEEKFGDEHLTEWGEEKWYGHKVVDTELYITVKLTDGTEYELNINPSYSNADGDATISNTLYTGNRRYPGTDTRIWLRQIRAQYDWGYDDLARDVSPTDEDFEWWRVNPYWK